MTESVFVNGRLETSDKSIEIKYQATIVQSGNDWGGEFFVKEDISPGAYELVTDDGRRGKIVVKRVFPGIESTRCEFEGAGDFLS